MSKPESVASALQAIEASSAQARFARHQAIGVAILSVIAAAVAGWMQVKGKAALNTHSAPVPPAIGGSRFDANPWKLPQDAMLGFVSVPGGAFRMGSDPALDRVAYDNERWSAQSAQGEVELPEFYIGRFEVTVAQFGAFIAATGRTVDAQSLRGHADHPVANVTWSDAIEYGRWLESQLRTSDRAPAKLRALLDEGWRITLPSEAQWEKAARSTDGRLFPWGNEPDPSKANYGRSGTAVVGSFTCANCVHGLADMSGNVWELTRSPFQPYPWTADDEPRDPQADALFVMRGGAFNDPANNIRAATRGGIDPGARRPFIGFRVVLAKPHGES